MSDQSVNLFNNEARSEWVRSRTLIILRWMAIAGQTTAVLIATYILGFQLNIALCSLAIGASILLNVITAMVLPITKRLSERETTLMLLFDIFQLVILLALTGGLNNPFSLLILAPVTISATALTARATLFLGVVAVSLVTVLAYYFIPLIDHMGRVLALPDIFLLGNWVALLLGITFLAAYARRVTIETFYMSQALAATQMALEREHKLSALGGVVAAAAHEMGTPLATIKLVAAELQEDLSEQPELKEDAQLIHEQAIRLHSILKDMGRSGKDDLLMKSTTFLNLIDEAAEPHENRGKEILYYVNGLPLHVYSETVPMVLRHPQVIHGLRNLIQNAVDFAKNTVWIHASWTDQKLSILVADDGPGYPADLISRIGDPFLPRQRHSTSRRSDLRPGYEGMGLGLFIAKTLLEGSGAKIDFANAVEQLPFLDDDDEAIANGAVVSVTWNREKLEYERHSLGPNQPVEI